MTSEQLIKCEACGKHFDVTNGMSRAIKHRDKTKHTRFIPVKTGRDIEPSGKSHTERFRD